MTTDKPKEQVEEHEFKAQTQRVLALVINSLYTNSEVFLRELVSNASDALDRARYVQLTEKDEVTEQSGEPGIHITLDADNSTLTIEDNGIGMTRDEAVENLGTVARSGTDDFISKLAELKEGTNQDAALELIGQFGVGFYAAFMVATRVDVHTLSMRKGAKPLLWRSGGEGTFTILPGEREEPGTRIVLHFKEDAAEFAKKWRVEAIIKKYSDFVMFPIHIDGEVANKSSALWRSPRAQITDEQHAEFFKHITQGRHGDTPLATIHYSVDAPVQFSALLYLPEKAPFDTFMAQQEREGLRLYAKRILIMESCDKLLPGYLRFVRGVVDSEDLTLNVSRETLQENRTVRQIEQQLTKQVLKKLKSIAEQDAERYAAFWRELGQALKEGMSTDHKNRDALADLCRFESLNNDEGLLISLKQYVDTKAEGQDKIYYITGASRAQVERSPHLEVFRKKGIDVLLLVDPIDEWVVQSLPAYEELALTSVVHGELDLGEDEDEDDKDSDDADESKDALAAAVDAIKSALGDRVDEVRVSSRLTETACCLVSKEGAPSAHLERLMKVLDERAQAKARVLEINPTHEFIKNIGLLAEKDKDAAQIPLWSEMLYDQALLSEGVVEDPAKLVQRIQELLTESSKAAVK